MGHFYRLNKEVRSVPELHGQTIDYNYILLSHCHEDLCYS